MHVIRLRAVPHDVAAELFAVEPEGERPVGPIAAGAIVDRSPTAPAGTAAAGRLASAALAGFSAACSFSASKLGMTMPGGGSSGL